MLKQIFVFLIFTTVTTSVLASGISATNGVAQPSTCDTDTLETATGPAKLRAEFTPEVINLRWYNDDTRINVPTTSNSCTYDTAISLPTNPTKPGYKFAGWDVIPGIPVQYIESTGTQWIDTGVTTGVIGVTVDTNVLITDWSRERAFVGVKEICSLFELYTNTGSSTPFMALWNRAGSYARVYGIQQNAIHNVKAGLTASSIKLIVDGTDYTANITPASRTGDISTFTFTLFHLCDNDIYNAKAKMYYFKLYKDGVLLRDMIPIKDYDNVPCMYDQVSKQIFYNAGTGDFIAGPEI